MLDRYGPIYTAAPPLAYHDAIYWIAPALYYEWSISRYVLRDAKFDARRHAEEGLRLAAPRLVAEKCPDWRRYVTVPSEHWKDDDILVLRHTLYEQPGYREIKLWRAPSNWTTFRQLDESMNVIDLPLRRLMYHGEAARGALHDDVLYVVFSTINISP